MTKLLSQDDYAVQRVDLERAISYAEAEYHSASFKAQTGAGDTKGAKAAKDHLDALNASLEGLHAAWRGSEQARAKDALAARDHAFAELTSDVNTGLVERAAKLDEIVQASEALAAAMNAHHDLTQAIRRKVLDYRTNYARNANIDGLESVLAGGVRPGAIAGAVLSLGGIQTSLIGGDRFHFQERSAAEMEQRQAQHVRSQLENLAPKKEG